MPRIRPATADDVPGCARVCLLTGRYGADGTADFPTDADALSRLYTTPYLRLAPAAPFALVLEAAGDDGAPAGDVLGYCLATADTAAFVAAFERDERPALVAAFSGPPLGAADNRSLRERAVHAQYAARDWCASPRGAAGERHPAHLHVDLLPGARRAGWGRALVELQLAQLARAGARGVFVNLAASNDGAAAFYAALGFAPLGPGPGEGADATLFMGAPLASP